MSHTWRYLAGGGALLLAGVVASQVVPPGRTPDAIPTAAPTPVAGSADEASTAAAATRLAEAEAEIQRLTEALKAREAENAELRATIALRDTVLDTLKASDAEREAALADLRLQLDASNRELAALRDRIAGVGPTGDFDTALVALKSAAGPSVARLETARVDAGFTAPAAPAADPAMPLAAEASGPLVEVQFEFASAALTPGGEERASLAAATLSAMPLARVRVVGHTDRVGNPAANRRLAARRADAVARFLVGAGLPAEILATDGMGEAGAPIATADGVAEPLNRAVLIFAEAKPTS